MPRGLEDKHQIALFDWARHIPDLKNMFHIPNGGKRNGLEAIRFKRMGVKPGVSDVFLPVAKNGYHGLWIELKTPIEMKPTVTKFQREWLADMCSNGYLAVICYGWLEARDVINKYIGGGYVK